MVCQNIIKSEFVSGLHTEIDFVPIYLKLAFKDNRFTVKMINITWLRRETVTFVWTDNRRQLLCLGRLRGETYDHFYENPIQIRMNLSVKPVHVQNHPQQSHLLSFLDVSLGIFQHTRGRRVEYVRMVSGIAFPIDKSHLDLFELTKASPYFSPGSICS